MGDNRKLYDNLLKSGKISEGDIGDFATFDSLLKTPDKANVLYKNLRKGDMFTEEEIGDSATFMSLIEKPVPKVETPETDTEAQSEYQLSFDKKPTLEDWEDKPEKTPQQITAEKTGVSEQFVNVVEETAKKAVPKAEKRFLKYQRNNIYGGFKSTFPEYSKEIDEIVNMMDSRNPELQMQAAARFNQINQSVTLDPRYPRYKNEFVNPTDVTTAAKSLIDDTNGIKDIAEKLQKQIVPERISTELRIGLENYIKGYTELGKRLDQSEQIRNLVTKLKEVEKGNDVKLSEEEGILLQALDENIRTHEDIKSKLPKSYDWATSAGYSLGFMAEFILGRGMVSKIAKPVKAILTAGKIGGVASPLSLGMLKLMEAGVQPALMPSLYRMIAEKRAEGKSLGRSFGEAWDENFKEVISEYMFMSPSDKIAKGFLNKFFKLAGVTLNTESGVKGFIKNMAEEYIEEKVAEIYSAPKDHKNFQSFWNQFINKQDNINTFASVAFISGAMSAPIVAMKSYDKVRSDIVLNGLQKKLPKEISGDIDIILKDKKLTNQEIFKLVGETINNRIKDGTIVTDPTIVASDAIKYAVESIKKIVRENVDKATPEEIFDKEIRLVEPTEKKETVTETKEVKEIEEEVKTEGEYFYNDVSIDETEAIQKIDESESLEELNKVNIPAESPLQEQMKAKETQILNTYELNLKRIADLEEAGSDQKRINEIEKEYQKSLKEINAKYEESVQKESPVKEESEEILAEKKTEISESQKVEDEQVIESEQKIETVKEKKENIRKEFGNNSYDILKNYINHSGEELIDYDRLISTTRNILKINPDDKAAAFSEALLYEMGYTDNWQDLRNAINKGGFERNRQAIERMIEVGVSLPKDISDLAKKYQEKPVSPAPVKKKDVSDIEAKKLTQFEVDATANGGFTESKDLNRIFKVSKEKYGEKKGSKYNEAANRLVNPNQNTIIEVRSNGVVVKRGEKYFLLPFTNTDANYKKWNLGSRALDVTEQYVSPKPVKGTLHEKQEKPEEQKKPEKPKPKEKVEKVKPKPSSQQDVLDAIEKQRQADPDFDNKKINDFLIEVRQYNRLTPAKKNRFNIASLNNRASLYGLSIKYTGDTHRTIVLLDSKGKEIKNPRKLKEQKERVEKGKGLSDYPTEIINFANKFFKLSDNIKRVVKLYNPMTIVTINSAIRDIKAGKKSKAANELLESINHFFDVGEIEFKARFGEQVSTFTLDEFDEIWFESELSKEQKEQAEQLPNDIVDAVLSDQILSDEQFKELYEINPDWASGYVLLENEIADEKEQNEKEGIAKVDQQGEENVGSKEVAERGKSVKEESGEKPDVVKDRFDKEFDDNLEELRNKLQKVNKQIEDKRKELEKRAKKAQKEIFSKPGLQEGEIETPLDLRKQNVDKILNPLLTEKSKLEKDIDDALSNKDDIIKKRREEQEKIDKAQGSLFQISRYKKKVNFRGFLNKLGLTGKVEGLDKSAHVGKINSVNVIIQQGDNESEAIIESIRTPKILRGKGKAQKALTKIINEADKNGITLKLRAEPEEGAKITQQQLIDWYKKNGFVFAEGSNRGVRSPNVKLQAEEQRMVRAPKKIFDAILERLFGTKLATAIITDKAKIEEKLKQYGIKKLQDLKRQATAWHGTPYDFEKFSTEKIGTGEGAQAFGWGLYFTELEDIAEYYAKMLYRKLIYQQKIIEVAKQIIIPKYWDNGNSATIYEAAAENLSYMGVSFDENDIATEISNTLYNGKNKFFDDKLNEHILKNREKLWQRQKYVYKVTLHKGKQPGEYSWLEWNKLVPKNILKKIVELNETAEKYYNEIERIINKYGSITTAINKGDTAELKKLMNETERQYSLDDFRKINTANNGSALYEVLTDQLGGQKEASLFLLRAGIDGIKYPAESLSGKPARGYNYVVFDENAITIEEKLKFMATTSGEVYGFTTPEGEIYIDIDKININTPIHEYGHLWIGWAKNNATRLFEKGLKLADDKNSPYFKEIWDNPAYGNLREQYEAGNKTDFLEEVLATAIGDKGEQFVNSKRKTDFKQWLLDLFNAIKKALGISQYTAKQLQDITFDEFSQAVAIELLKGEEIAKKGGTQNAEKVGTSIEKTGTEEGIEGREGGRIRVRNNETDRLASETGEEIRLAAKFLPKERIEQIKQRRKESSEARKQVWEQVNKTFDDATKQRPKIRESNKGFEKLKPLVQNLIDKLGSALDKKMIYPGQINAITGRFEKATTVKELKNIIDYIKRTILLGNGAKYKSSLRHARESMDAIIKANRRDKSKFSDVKAAEEAIKIDLTQLTLEELKDFTKLVKRLFRSPRTPSTEYLHIINDLFGEKQKQVREKTQRIKDIEGLQQYVDDTALIEITDVESYIMFNRRLNLARKRAIDIFGQLADTPDNTTAKANIEAKIGDIEKKGEEIGGEFQEQLENFRLAYADFLSSKLTSQETKDGIDGLERKEARFAGMVLVHTPISAIRKLNIAEMLDLNIAIDNLRISELAPYTFHDLIVKLNAINKTDKFLVPALSNINKTARWKRLLDRGLKSSWIARKHPFGKDENESDQLLFELMKLQSFRMDLFLGNTSLTKKFGRIFSQVGQAVNEANEIKSQTEQQLYDAYQIFAKGKRKNKFWKFQYGPDEQLGWRKIIGMFMVERRWQSSEHFKEENLTKDNASYLNVIFNTEKELHRKHATDSKSFDEDERIYDLFMKLARENDAFKKIGDIEVLDIDKLENVLRSDPGIDALIRTIDKIYEDYKGMHEMATLFNGRGVKFGDKYFSFQSKDKRMQIDDGNILNELLKVDSGARLQTGSTYQWTGAKMYIETDVIPVINSYTEGIRRNYFIYPLLRENIKAIRMAADKIADDNIKQSNNDNRMSMLGNVIAKALLERTAMYFKTGKYHKEKKMFDILEKGSKKALLAKPAKTVTETTANVIRMAIVMEKLPMSIYARIKENKDFYQTFVSEYIGDKYFSRWADEVNETIYKNKWAEYAEVAADFFITFADKTVGKAMFVGYFTDTFKSITGKEFSEKEYQDDPSYRFRYAEAIDDATTTALSRVEELFNNKNPLSNAQYLSFFNGLINMRADSGMARVFNFLMSFGRNEANQIVDSVRRYRWSGQGSKERIMAKRDILGVVTSNFMYGILRKMMSITEGIIIAQVSGIFGKGGGDDDKYIDEQKQQLKSGKFYWDYATKRIALDLILAGSANIYESAATFFLFFLESTYSIDKGTLERFYELYNTRYMDRVPLYGMADRVLISATPSGIQPMVKDFFSTGRSLFDIVDSLWDLHEEGLLSEKDVYDLVNIWNMGMKYLLFAPSVPIVERKVNQNMYRLRKEHIKQEKQWMKEKGKGTENQPVSVIKM